MSKRVQYVGSRPNGLTVRFPYPHVSKSAECGSVSFAGPGDVQVIENHQDAAALVQNGGGQFVYEVDAKEKPAEAPQVASSASAPSGPAPKAPKAPKKSK